jgi:putative ABC transport system permease protein
MNSFEASLLRFTDDWRNPAGLAVLAAVLFVALLYWEYTRFILKSLRRNLLRSILTGMATFVLVLVITLIWSILAFLDRQTEAKSRNLKAVVTEKYQMPSAMPYAYTFSLSQGAVREKDHYRIDAGRDAMAWSMYAGTLDPNKKTRENGLFLLAMEPRKLLLLDSLGNFSSMMDEIDQLSDREKHRLADACVEMEQYPYKIVVGPARLAAINKKVGERVKVTSLNYKDIDLEFEIAAELPGSRYEQMAVMNYHYLDEALRKYNQGKAREQQHPMTQKTLGLMWLRVPDTVTFDKVAGQITSSPEFKSPAVKCETASSGMAAFLDAYKDLLWGMRWMLVPIILATMALVIANAISISVRERRTEMAVLKVLGFTPDQILLLVLGEALVIGCSSGILSVGAVYYLVNKVIGGVALPVGFFGKFFIDGAALWWGLGIGAGTALAGSLLPAWSARSVKVAEVFSRVS